MEAAAKVANDLENSIAEAKRDIADIKDAVNNAKKSTTEVLQATEDAKQSIHMAKNAGADSVKKEAEEAADVAMKLANDADQIAKEAKKASDKTEEIISEAEKTKENVKQNAANLKNIINEATQITGIPEDHPANTENAITKTNQAAKSAKDASTIAEKAIKDIKQATSNVKVFINKTKQIIDRNQQAAEDIKRIASNAQKVAKEKEAVERPIPLPQCIYDSNKQDTPLPKPTKIGQIPTVQINDIDIIGLNNVFPKEVTPKKVKTDTSLDFILRKGLAEQSMACILIEQQSEKPIFKWLDAAKEMKETADLLRNCLLSVKLPHYSTPAIIPLRTARPEESLKFSFLGRNNSSIENMIDIDNVPLNKELGLELLNLPQEWKIKNKSKQPEELPNKYNIHVGKAAPIYFSVTIDQINKKDEKPFSRYCMVKLTYLGAGNKSQIIYPKDITAKRDQKEMLLENKLTELLKELQDYLKIEKKVDNNLDKNNRETIQQRIIKLEKEKEELIKRFNDSKKEKDDDTTKIQQLEDGIMNIEGDIKELNDIEKEFQELNPNKAELDFRIYIMIDTHKVNLITTEQPN